MRGLFFIVRFSARLCVRLLLDFAIDFVAWFCAFVILYIDKAFGEVTVLSLKPYLTDNLTDK